MKTRINYKKAVVWGIIVFVFDSIVGNMLYMNPLVSGIFKTYEGHPSTKPMEYFDGVGNWLMLTMLFGALLVTAFIALYLVLYQSLPGSGWRKGLFYGLMLGGVKAVPEAFNQWMIFDYPTELIVVQLVNTLLGLTIFGIVLSAVFGKFKVIEETSYEWQG